MASDYIQDICVSAMRVAFIFIIITILLLLVMTRFKEKQRIILWSAGLVIFLTALLGAVSGLLNPANHSHLMFLLLSVCVSGTYVITAEKWYKKSLMNQSCALQVEDKDNVEESSDATAEENVSEENLEVDEKDGKVVLSPRLDKSVARDVFSNAIDCGLMTEDNGHYKWLVSKVLLAYMLGRIYCGDRIEYDKHDYKYYWVPGKGLFPGGELEELFCEQNIAQSRQNRKEKQAPDGYNKIDRLF